VSCRSQSPEHKFSQPPEDVSDILAWAAEHASSIGGDAASLAIGGDSASCRLAALEPASHNDSVESIRGHYEIFRSWAEGGLEREDKGASILSSQRKHLA